MFPEVFIDLQAEIQQHEQLLINLLQLPKDASMEMKLGEVAAYCEVVLDGYYGEEDVINLCDILVRRMQRIRGKWTLDISLPLASTPTTH